MSNHPDWVTTAGSIGTFPSQVPMTFTFEATPKLPATAITYTVLSGTIPTGLTLNSETGVLSGSKLAKIKVYQDQGHNARQVVYSSNEFYDWMFAQKRK